MSGTASTRRFEAGPASGALARGLVRQASAWRGGHEPERLPLERLEESDAIRWVDVDAAAIDGAEALALLEPICDGELNGRMVRDLISPSRFPAGRDYPGGQVSITAAFRTRHLQPDAGPGEVAEVVSVFEPVHFLVGNGWLITAWLEPRVFRGSATPPVHGDEASEELYAAVARAWRRSEAETVEELAELVRRELAVACGYRPAD